MCSRRTKNSASASSESRRPVARGSLLLGGGPSAHEGGGPGWLDMEAHQQHLMGGPAWRLVEQRRSTGEEQRRGKQSEKGVGRRRKATRFFSRCLTLVEDKGGRARTWGGTIPVTMVETAAVWRRRSNVGCISREQ
jgi:hypothetical protein